MAILAHLDPVNGPWYWKWGWRRLPLLPTAGLFAPLILVAWGVTRAAARTPRRGSVPFLLSLLALGTLWGQLASALAEPTGLEFVGDIVRSPVATSYFSDAARIEDLPTWLARFPSDDLRLHSLTHPPGPVLFYYSCIRLVGVSAAPALGAGLLALLTASAVFLVYPFAALWTEDSRSKLIACAYFSLLPSISLFFPEFDQVYPLVTLGLSLLWERACRGDRAAAAGAGALLAFGSFFAYNLLTLGAFMALWGASEFLRDADRAAARRISVAVLLSIAAFVGLYAVASMLLGYNPFRSFQGALRNQQALAALVDRPYFPCAVLDLYDFVMGFGISALPLLLQQADHVLREPAPRSRPWTTSVLAAATILIVDASGLLRAESSRVWIFLYPFLLAPLGVRLSTLRQGELGLLLACEWTLMVAIKSNWIFISP